MEESSERPVRLGEFEIPECPWTKLIEMSTDILASSPVRYKRHEMCDFWFFDSESLIGTGEFLETDVELIRGELSLMTLRPTAFSDLVLHLREDLLLHAGVCEQPRPPLGKARRTRDLPSRVSRRSSYVPPPIYQRHRFLPQSRTGSTRRQR
ncbi:unnamed protein product [Arabis nemorensis]|uniref:Uncharacterized protein n=1 Tax=Arabis nemorensis TaxID=586526 RepID=A0A565CA43_9BRAS|nr:unnamed protein product [Arabis nemorensis]